MLTKDRLHRTIDRLPDDLTVDQIINELILLDKIDQGLNDVNQGKVYATEEVKNKLNKWLK
jgi:predicted transcriptional regulator